MADKTPLMAFRTPTTLSNYDDARLSRIEAALPRARAGGVLYSPSASTIPSSSGVLSSGQISPSTGIASAGNVFTFVVQGAFNFTATATAVTIYWDGTNGSQLFVIKRASGDNVSIPGGSIVVSGLQPSTQYGFAPFIAVAQPQTMSFVVGDSGNPRYAFSPNSSSASLSSAAQVQRLTINEAITTGLIYYTTTSGATSSSGGGSVAPPSPYTGNSDEYLG